MFSASRFALATSSADSAFMRAAAGSDLLARDGSSTAMAPSMPHTSLGPHLDKACSGEVAVERECLADPKGAHDRKACGVDERVVAFIPISEPAKRLLLQIAADELESEPCRPLETIQERDCASEASAPPQKSPGFAAYVIRGHEPPRSVLREEVHGHFV